MLPNERAHTRIRKTLLENGYALSLAEHGRDAEPERLDLWRVESPGIELQVEIQSSASLTLSPRMVEEWVWFLEAADSDDAGDRMKRIMTRLDGSFDEIATVVR